MEKLYVTRTSLPPFEEYCAEIRDLWDSALITNMGVKHQRLQQELEAFLEGPLTLFANGHLALESVLEALELPKGSEVITTPFTFVSTVHAIVRKGLVPVFCDVLEADGTLDPEKAEALVTESTAAILPVHVYGHPCRAERVLGRCLCHGGRVCREYGRGGFRRILPQRSADRRPRPALHEHRRLYGGKADLHPGQR